MGVRILKARLRVLEQFQELESCTFVWDEGDEASEGAILDLIRGGAMIEDFKVSAASAPGKADATMAAIRLH
jgi:hypothetical protein